MLTETVTLTTNEQAALAGGVVGGAILGTIFAISIAIFVLYIIANWKIFKKAGEPGWKALIPIYNIYIGFKIVGMKSWFWVMLAISIISSIIMSVNQVNIYAENVDFSVMPTAALIPLIVIGIFELIIGVMYCYRLSKAFRHGIGFTLGLIFLSIIFWFILAFGDSKYDKKILKD